MSISVSWQNMRELQKLLSGSPDKMNTALARAVNRTVSNVKKNISLEVRKKYLVKAADVKNSFDITNATKNKPVALVRSSGKKIDLTKFRLRPTGMNKGEHDYSVQVLKDGGMKEVPGFAAKAPTWGLFRRTGAARYPISRLMGPAIPEMINRPDVMEYVENEANDMLKRRIQQEIKFIMKMTDKK